MSMQCTTPCFLLCFDLKWNQDRSNEINSVYEISIMASQSLNIDLLLFIEEASSLAEYIVCSL